MPEHASLPLAGRLLPRSLWPGIGGVGMVACSSTVIVCIPWYHCLDVLVVSC